MENLTQYEVTLVVPGSLRESEQKKVLAKYEEQLVAMGKIVHKATWVNHDLAYTIRKETKGTYGIFVLSADGQQMDEFGKSLRLDNQLIRFMIFKTPKAYQWKEYNAEDLDPDFTKYVVVRNPKAVRASRNDNKGG